MQMAPAPVIKLPAAFTTYIEQHYYAQVSTWTELFGLGFGGNTSNKGPQSLKLQLHAEFNCVHLLN